MIWCMSYCLRLHWKICGSTDVLLFETFPTPCGRQWQTFYMVICNTSETGAGTLCGCPKTHFLCKAWIHYPKFQFSTFLLLTAVKTCLWKDLTTSWVSPLGICVANFRFLASLEHGHNERRSLTIVYICGVHYNEEFYTEVSLQFTIQSDHSIPVPFGNSYFSVIKWTFKYCVKSGPSRNPLFILQEGKRLQCDCSCVGRKVNRFCFSRDRRVGHGLFLS